VAHRLRETNQITTEGKAIAAQTTSQIPMPHPMPTAAPASSYSFAAGSIDEPAFASPAHIPKRHNVDQTIVVHFAMVSTLFVSGTTILTLTSGAGGIAGGGV
jgi:hypothetical protein